MLFGVFEQSPKPVQVIIWSIGVRFNSFAAENYSEYAITILKNTWKISHRYKISSPYPM